MGISLPGLVTYVIWRKCREGYRHEKVNTIWRHINVKRGDQYDRWYGGLANVAILTSTRRPPGRASTRKRIRAHSN